MQSMAVIYPAGLAANILNRDLQATDSLAGSYTHKFITECFVELLNTSNISIKILKPFHF